MKKTLAVLLLSVALPLPLAAQTASDSNASATQPGAASTMDPAKNAASGTQLKTDGQAQSNDMQSTDGTAQSTTTPADSSSTAAQSTSSTTKATQTASGETFVTVPESGAWRVADLEGKSVYDAKGEDIGDIQDVLVNQDGTVAAVIIGVGGFLGIGEKNVAVSMQALEFGPGMTAAEVNAAAQNSTNPAVSNETTASTTMNKDTAANAPAATTDDQVAASNSNVKVTVGDDALPNRIVLKVTREELESAPAFEGVKAD